MFQMDSNIEQIKALRANRKLGQNFMVNEAVAESEAEYALGRNAIELGPGFGILTKKLCKKAARVLAVERDERLYELLEQNLKCKNATVVKGDFFKQPDKIFDGYDIMVSNIPYNLSSKTISWLAKTRIEALLCVQKEFAEHMLAKQGTKKYSRLSVMSHLMFDIYQIMRVPRNNFYPVPKVDSMIVYMRPKKVGISAKVTYIINLLMEHKKKSLRNALLDSRKALGLTQENALSISESLSLSSSRVFKLSPEQIAQSAEEVAASLSIKR